MPHSTNIDTRWYAEQRNKDGSIRRYWQPRGQKPVRLPDDIDWIKTITQLNRQRDAERNQVVMIDGTVAWVIQKYRESDRFRRLSPSSTKIYTRWLRYFENTWGAMPITGISKRVVLKFSEMLRDRPATQRHAVLTLYNVFSEAQRWGLIGSENPASRVGLSKPRRRQEVWSPDDCAAWIREASQHRLAATMVPYFKLLERTAQRPGDVLAMQWQQYDGLWINLTQQKTGKLVRIPVHHELRAILDRAQQGDAFRVTGPIITQPDGRRYKIGHLTAVFREISRAAGLDHLQARDLRRTACVRFAEADCTEIQIAAISGHNIERTRQILETYVPRTDAMGRAAMDKLERKEAKESDASDLKGGQGIET